MKYPNIREEEIKNKVAQDYFWLHDCTQIIGNVDFCVGMHQSQKEPFERESLLWAEAKRDASDIYTSIVQLILTIGKARTFDKYLPPAFLGAFDGEKIAFIPYSDIHDIFYLNDFNWNVTPSKHDTREFKLIHEKVKTIIDSKTLLFNYLKDDDELKNFIKNNFAVSKFGLTKTKIDKNNFLVIYSKWLDAVKPTIEIDDWEAMKHDGIIDGDFYLADLLSDENKTLKEKLQVLLRSTHYELDRHKNKRGLFTSSTVDFIDNQKVHTQFWNRYERPPKEEYWDYIINRRDLLVPQDVRERKGSFFTPQIWVELSQRYIADVLGEDWQDEYHVWDCAAGTGNLLAGLTNKYHIWASTLDRADVDVMKDRIENGANLLESHVFQFDFLNDDFSKLPQGLQDIINDPKKRKKLIIYINPPYAEASNRSTIVSKGENKSKVATTSKVYSHFQNIVGTATRELFAQFFLRIYNDIPNCKLASFSTLKYVSAQYFDKFRSYFKADFKSGFICKANSFDNVNGQFPIGFSILDLSSNNKISKIEMDVYDNDVKPSIIIWHLGKKNFYAYQKGTFIIDWLRKHYDKKGGFIAYLRMQGTDIQNNLGVFISNKLSENDLKKHLYTIITQNNLIEVCIYFSVRKVIPATWLNDRDQFLYPNDGWKTDLEFQNDCLAYTLFNNNIQSKYGTNHWIPFTEYQVGARDNFSSNFMTDFISGKTDNCYKVCEPMLFFGAYIDSGDSGGIGGGVGNRGSIGGGDDDYKPSPRKFSETARNVFNAGRELWKYYQTTIKEGREEVGAAVNASLYDIREYFQGRNNQGKMNNKSDDETYNELINNLRLALKILANKIEPKVYEYGFLRE